MDTTTTKTIAMEDCTECIASPDYPHMISLVNPLTGRSFWGNETLEEIRKEYPSAEIMDIDAFCEAKAAQQRTPIEWRDSNQESYDYALEVLPPIDWEGGYFLVGEAADHDYGTGQPRYYAWRYDGRESYQVSSRPITRAELREIRGR